MTIAASVAKHVVIDRAPSSRAYCVPYDADLGIKLLYPFVIKVS